VVETGEGEGGEGRWKGRELRNGRRGDPRMYL